MYRVACFKLKVVCKTCLEFFEAIKNWIERNNWHLNNFIEFIYASVDKKLTKKLNFREFHNEKALENNYMHK